MLRHDGYISLCLNIRIVGVSIHYCTAERISRILICECVLVMADSHKRFTDESSFDDRNSHDPVNPLAAVEPSAHPAEGAGPPPDGGQGDLPPLLKKKPTSFQITSVTVQGSRLSTDGGDDSADDLDESHTEDLSSDVLDLSRTTDVDNDPLSEENSNNAAAEAVKSIPVKQAAESQPTKVETPTAESDIPSLSSNINMQSVPTVLPTSTLPVDVSNTKSAEPTNEPSTKAPTIPDQWQHRFKVVKIVSSQPYKRGRWLCMDFMDPPSIPVSEAKSEVPVEAMTNVTVGSGSHAETVMCGTQTTNNVAHVYEIPPNESYPGSISVTVCPQPIQQPFYGIFLPLNNSQMPDMAAMPRGFAQDSTRKFESNVPSMQPITVGFINQPSQFSNVSSSMQQAPSYVSGSNKSYEESSTQSQSYVSQPPSQTQSFAPQSQQQQPLATQSQNFSSASQQQQQPTQTTQAQSFVPQSQQQQQQQPLVTQSQNFSSVPQQQQQQQQPVQTTQVQSFAPQSQQQQQPLVTQSQNFSSVPQQQQPALTTQAQSFAPQSQQQQPLVTQSQNFSSVPQQQQQPAQTTQAQSFAPQSQQQQPLVTQSQNFSSVPQQQTTQSFAPQSQQQPLVTQSQTFSSVSQQQPPVQTAQTQSFIQQPTSQVLSSAAPSVQIQSVSQAGSQQLTPTQPVSDTSIQVTQAVSSVVASSVQQQALPSEQIPPSLQPAVLPSTAFTSQNQNLTQTSGSSEPVPPMTAGQAMSTATTVSSGGGNIPSVNVPSSIPDNVISSIMQPTTSKEVHNVPSQLHYNHVDARENVQSSATQPAAESASECSASKTVTADEAESAPSGSNTVAIDNKIEQAMDLVKSHLMFAVREEVDVLKEKITELVERISLLEYENTFLKANASQETLSQLNQSQQLHQQQQQQQQQTQNAAIATTQSQPQQNLQSQQPTL